MLHDVVWHAVAHFHPYILSLRWFPVIVCTRAVLISHWRSALHIRRCGRYICTEMFLADFVFHEKLFLFLLLMIMIMKVMIFFLFLFLGFVTFLLCFTSFRRFFIYRRIVVSVQISGGISQINSTAEKTG